MAEREGNSAKSFRLVCDKPCSNKILKTRWSPVRDLIAVLTSNGDIRLHRMCWQRVWVLSTKDNHAASLAWRPDGKVLAVGYENGTVKLVEIEKATIIHSFHLDGCITSLEWTIADSRKDEYSGIYVSNHKDYIPKIENSDSKSKNDHSKLITQDSKSNSILAVGTSKGELALFLDGVYKASSQVTGGVKQDKRVVSSYLHDQVGTITIVTSVEDPNNSRIHHIGMFQHRSELLSSRREELSYISLKYTYTNMLIQQCEQTLKSMLDASEDVCLKINSKLEKLEKMVEPCEESVSSEFTMAYATGIASAELQAFLTQDLTTKGLKQIAQSVQSAYTSLFTNVRDELESVSQELLFHFNDLLGMSKWEDRFGSLGLVHEHLQDFVVCLSQFILKVQELMGVISSDMENFRVFFTWLQYLVVRMSGEYAAGETSTRMKQFNNEDYDIMLNFLEKRLVKIPGQSGYDLERVSQFFKEGCLESPQDSLHNGWYDFVQGNELLRNSPLIIQPDKESTLKELFSHLKEKFAYIFESVEQAITESNQQHMRTRLFCHSDDHDESCEVKVSMFSAIDGCLMLTVLPCSCDSDKMFLLQLEEGKSDTVYIYGIAAENPNLNESVLADYRYTIRDATFYNENLITMLIEEEYIPDESVVTILGQFPLSELPLSNRVSLPTSDLKGVLDEDIEIEWHPVIDKFTKQRNMESFRAKSVSVSGAVRHTSSVIASSGRRVRVFDMNADEEDEEEDEDDLTSSKLDDSKLDDSKLDDSKIDDSKIGDSLAAGDSSVNVTTEDNVSEVIEGSILEESVIIYGEEQIVSENVFVTPT